MTTLILVGGFLGAGKTTLLIAAANALRGRGVRSAMILNDQGAELVDTLLASHAGFEADEVTGACFCCRFSDFIARAERLLAHEPQVIFAEPVGSCMDISATILQPLKEYYRDRFRVAPFTVLVDPERARLMLAPDADPHLAYLFRNQIAEADIVAFTKADREETLPELPGVVPRRLSARTGQGVEAWLSEALDPDAAAGLRLLDVDYERYAEAEASLGWLNWRGVVELKRALRPAALTGPLLERLDGLLTEAAIPIAHLKVIDQTRTGYIKASVCRNGETAPEAEGDLFAAPARKHNLLINLRAKSRAEALERIVAQATGELAARVTVAHRESFQPGRPTPEHRFRRLA
ncbi:MAG: hypothetical protein KIT09_33090 [Bryobacteraceae bacterium]|nr:hypothetical protein [Bryobacteraceae bacterium]